jgi:hypothetical protein
MCVPSFRRQVGRAALAVLTLLLLKLRLLELLVGSCSSARE